MRTRWFSLTRLVQVGGGLIFISGLLVAGYVGLVLDWQARPFCHKQIMLSLVQWQDEQHTDAFPNVEGRGLASLELLAEMLATRRVQAEYRYVAGLRADDPGHLVILYLAQPTRWIWHGRPRSRFRARGWIVVPVDFAGSSGRQIAVGGECSEWLTDQEFATRLRSTLDFVRTNQRPHWETVVAEHTKFLESAHPDGP